jgi:ribosome-associated protein
MPDQPDPQTPYITLAQLVKMLDLAPTGGQSKAFVRAGGIIVNGEAEARPGRKLRQGDVVTIDGEDYEVDLVEEEDDEGADDAENESEEDD